MPSSVTGLHEPGTLSAALEDEVKGELRRSGIVVWLDKDGAYSAFVDRLAERHAAGEFFAPVVAFRGSFLGAPPASFDDLNGAFAGWLLTVEYVHDLKRPPHLQELQRLPGLSLPLRKTCAELIRHFRERPPESYVQFEEKVHQRLAGEIDAVSAEDLGRIDTFQVEEARVLEGASV